VVLSVAPPSCSRWTFLDAVGALVAGGFILKAAAEIAWPALREIAETGAQKETLERIRHVVEGTEGVRSFHDLRNALRRRGPPRRSCTSMVGPDITGGRWTPHRETR
jgi:divalent metal cation (Fe/Co/Zn/Cd) transporter